MIAGPRDIVWIDGVSYPVPLRVAQHIRFLADLNSRFAEKLALFARDARATPLPSTADPETQAKWAAYEAARIQHRADNPLVTREDIAEGEDTF